MPTSPIRFTRRSFLTHSVPTIGLALTTTRTETAHTQATPDSSPIASPTPPEPAIVVDPPNVRFDERFEVFVGGLEPNERVTVTSSFANSWSSQAEYMTDDYGYVALSQTAPNSGNFSEADSMAFIWAAGSPTSKGYSPDYDGEEIVEIRAETGSLTLTAQVKRTFGERQSPSVAISEPDGIQAKYFPPLDTDHPRPAIILIGGSEGGINSYLDTEANLLTQEGFGVLNLGYWGLPGLPTTMDQIPIEYFGKAIAWLQAQAGIDPNRIGMIGYSRGGEGALLTGAHYPEIKAVVCIGGSGLVRHDSWNPVPSPAWTWQGKDIAFAPPDATTDEDLAVAEIPVEEINGPVLLISSDADPLWPATYLSRIAWNRLQRSDHPFADQFLHYPGAGHGLPSPFQPVGPYIAHGHWWGGGDLSQTAYASESAWNAIKQHFNSALRPWE
jgi:dienelactone hydrolase